MKLPDSRYTVSREPYGEGSQNFTARFCRLTIGYYATELEAATALWDYHGDRMHDQRTACPVPLGMAS